MRLASILKVARILKTTRSHLLTSRFRGMWPPVLIPLGFPPTLSLHAISEGRTLHFSIWSFFGVNLFFVIAIFKGFNGTQPTNFSWLAVATVCSWSPQARKASLASKHWAFLSWVQRLRALENWQLIGTIRISCGGISGARMAFLGRWVSSFVWFPANFGRFFLWLIKHGLTLGLVSGRVFGWLFTLGCGRVKRGRASSVARFCLFRRLLACQRWVETCRRERTLWRHWGRRCGFRL